MCAAVLALLAAATPARALDGPGLLRVKVLEASGPVIVTSEADGRSLRLTAPPHRKGVAVDGRTLGPVFRPGGQGPWRVSGESYRGGLEIRRVGHGLQVINEIPLEVYVAGTLLAEVSEGWGDEALRALAVAIRTYAVHRAEHARERGQPFDLEADTRGQHYAGRLVEHPRAWAAVRATEGEVLVFRGEPILAAYHADAGGRTASASEVWGRAVPYLVSVEAPSEQESPETYWRVRLDAAMLARAVQALGLEIGPVRDLRVLETTPSGRVARVALRGERGRAVVEGRALRDALGAQVVRSTLFRVRREGDAIVLVGSGYGHGVGMSQWGARARARAGATHRDILGHFYPGTQLVRLGRSAPEPRAEARVGEER